MPFDHLQHPLKQSLNFVTLDGVFIFGMNPDKGQIVVALILNARPGGTRRMDTSLVDFWARF
jgi:hypothetical protein